MILISKIFATVLAIVVITRALSDFKQKKEGIVMTAFWVGIWVIALILAYYPILIDMTFNALKFEKTGFGKLYAMGMIFLLFITYRIYAKAQRVEKQIEELAREIALNKLEKNK